MEDFLPAFAWFLITYISASIAFHCSSILRGKECLAIRLTDAVILFWFWLTISVTLLSSAGLFGFYWFSAGIITLASGTNIFLLRLRERGGPLVSGCTRGETAPGAATKDSWPVTAPTLAWAVCGGLAGMLIVVHGVLRHPVDWDTLMYHRPLIVQWIQDRDLLASGDAVWYNPSGNELWGLWLAAPFSGDFWVGLMSIPSFLLLCSGLLSLLRLLRVSRGLALGVIVCVLGTTVPVRQIYCGKNDMAVVSLAIVAVVYIIRFGRENRREDCVFSAIAIGLLAGVKYYALGYAAVAFTMLTAISLLSHGWKRAVSTVIVAALVSVGTGGFWYMRNYSLTGTPFYPAGYKAEADEDTKQRRDVWGSTLLGNGRPEVAPQYFKAVRNWGGAAQAHCLVLLPASIVAFGISGIGLMRDRRLQRRGAEVAVLAAAVAGSWLVFGITPYTVSRGSEFTLHRPYLLARFSMLPLTASLIAVAMFIDNAVNFSTVDTRVVRRLAKAALGIWFIYFGWISLSRSIWRATRSFPWESVQVFGCCLFAILLCWYAAVKGRRAALACPGMARYRALVIYTVLVSLAFAVLSVRQSYWWHSNFYKFFDYKLKTTAYSELAAQPSGTRVAAVDHRYYPLFGSRRQFIAFRPSHLRSHESFRKYLLENKIDIVADALAKASPMTGYPSASRWLRSNNDLYAPSRPGAPYGLYRVNSLELVEQ